jgi:nucleotide-binding universal stress UspA family protein
VETAVAYGVPGVEICRFGERRDADLMVLGRKPRSQMARLLLGDTADAVARRSRLPCLFVPPGIGPIRRLLVALDGTERGIAVLQTACALARAITASLGVVTVEQEPAGEPVHLASALPVERSERLKSQVRMLLSRERVDGSQPLVDVRRGAVVEQVLAALEETAADALVVGYHRGGPPGVIEVGSTARHLAHLAPCAVLTVPL